MNTKTIFKDEEIRMVFYQMCNTWDMDFEEVFSTRHKRELSTMRIICWLAARVNCRASLKTIAKLTDRKHTTVLRGIRKAFCFRETSDELFMEYYNKVKKYIND